MCGSDTELLSETPGLVNSQYDYAVDQIRNSMNEELSGNRRRRRHRSQTDKLKNSASKGKVEPVTGGLYRPLTSPQIQAIHNTKLEILEKTGLSITRDIFLESRKPWRG